MEYDDKIQKRLRRIEGQMRGILKMMDARKSCEDVVCQLTAVRSAVDKSIACIVAGNLESCIVEQAASGSTDTEKLVQEAVELLIKSR